MNTQLCIVDLETSGLDPHEHEILEIGCVIDGKEFTVKVKPTRMQYASERALEINGYTPEAWADAVPLDAALHMLNDFVGEKPLFMAYNATFDWGFISEAYRSTGIDNPFTYQKLCLMSIAWAKVGWEKVPTLKNACIHYGIEPEPSTHRALAGAQCAYQILKKLI